MCKLIIYDKHVRANDLTGNRFGAIFAEAIGGLDLERPIGIADVVYGERHCWSTKTIHSAKPYELQSARIISGRCSPDYSYGISDARADIQKTGAAVLNIYNERIGKAKALYNPLRAIVLVRYYKMFQFVLFEQDIHQYAVNDYEWRYNDNKNIEAFDNRGNRHFTWQFSGSQLTVHYNIPASAIKFEVKRPPILEVDEQLETIGYKDSWISFK